MVLVPTFVWVIAGVATAFAILGLLNALANETAHETGVHELRKQVVDLRVRYLHRMVEHYGLQEPDDTIEVEIVEDSFAPGAASDAETAAVPALETAAAA